MPMLVKFGFMPCNLHGFFLPPQLLVPDGLAGLGVSCVFMGSSIVVPVSGVPVVSSSVAFSSVDSFFFAAAPASSFLTPVSFLGVLPAPSLGPPAHAQWPTPGEAATVIPAKSPATLSLVRIFFSSLWSIFLSPFFMDYMPAVAGITILTMIKVIFDICSGID